VGAGRDSNPPPAAQRETEEVPMANEMVGDRLEGLGHANAFIDRDEPRAKGIAGVSVPDSPLITAAIDYARRVSEPYLFNHAMRSWLFAELIGRTKGIGYDREVVAVGTILHDIGLTAGVSGPNRFEVNSADAAVAFIAGRGLSDRRAQLIWDLVALNSTPSLALHKEPEVALGTMGIGLDYGGFGLDAVQAGDVRRIVSDFPRLRMKDKFSQACCRIITERPETSHDNFLRDFGERFVPGYKAVSTVDLLMNAPFDE
jgi:hypothetical protein